jgi:hypothetical protein
MLKLIRTTRNRLQPLIQHAQVAGAKTTIAKRLTELTGTEVRPFQVGCWLAPQEQDWKQPVATTFVALEIVQQETCGDIK